MALKRCVHECAKWTGMHKARSPGHSPPCTRVPCIWNAQGSTDTHLRKRPVLSHEHVKSGVLLVHERVGRQRPVSAERGLLAQQRLQRSPALGHSLLHSGGRQERLGLRSIYLSVRAEGIITDRDLVRAKATACVGGIGTQIRRDRRQSQARKSANGCMSLRVPAVSDIKHRKCRAQLGHI